MSEIIEQHIPCPCGKSSDAYCVYDDGHGYCYSCNKYTEPKRLSMEELKELDEKEGEGGYYPSNGLLLNSLEFYDVKTKFIDKVPVSTGYVYPNGFVKIRRLGDNIAKKDRFYSIGQATGNHLFGKNRFDPGSKKSITITEGEKDAISVYQITGGSTAAVSVRNAATAFNDCSAEYEYINSFDKIIFCFDNDTPGQEALKKAASLFDFKKVYIVKLTKYKDANEYLANNEAKELFSAWANAKRYTPDNIISSFNEIEKSLEESKEDMIVDYPFRSLNDNLWGLFKGDVIVFKGAEGIGKTEMFRAMEYHILKHTKVPIGILHLEEDNATTVKAIATYELKQPVIIPDSGVSNQEIMQAYKNAVGGSEDRVFIHSSFDFDDTDTIVNNIRFLASGCGCEIIFLDHITWLATGSQDEDERKKLDRVSQSLKLLAKELRICIIMISHTNDDGKTRGSRNISHVANTVIHMERNKIATDASERLRTYLTIEKARLGGKTGPVGYVEFDPTSYTLRDASEKVPL